MKALSNDFLNNFLTVSNNLSDLRCHLESTDTMENFKGLLYLSGFTEESHEGLLDFIEKRNGFVKSYSADFIDFSNAPTLDEILNFDDTKKFNPYTLQQYVISATRDYEEKYGREDCGSCGFSSVYISCGRSRKIVNELSKSYELSKESAAYTNKTVYNLHMSEVMKNVPLRFYMLPVQTIDFFEAINCGLRDGLKSEAERLGFDLNKIDIYESSFLD